MSSPLQELYGGHMVVLQEKVLQVTLVRQFVDNFLEGLIFCLLSKIEVSSVRSRESLDTISLFSSVAVRSEGISKELEVQGLRHQCLDHVFPQAVPFLLSDVQEVCHPHLHLHACPLRESDMLVLLLTWRRLG